jgi:hypothetical protein
MQVRDILIAPAAHAAVKQRLMRPRPLTLGTTLNGRGREVLEWQTLRGAANNGSRTMKRPEVTPAAFFLYAAVL